jgi:hypothetical protein
VNEGMASKKKNWNKEKTIFLVPFLFLKGRGHEMNNLVEGLEN